MGIATSLVNGLKACFSDRAMVIGTMVIGATLGAASQIAPKEFDEAVKKTGEDAAYVVNAAQPHIESLKERFKKNESGVCNPICETLKPVFDRFEKTAANFKAGYDSKIKL